METFDKTISIFETKPYEILQDNIEFLQNELRSKDEIIKILIETQTAVLENLPLSKPPQQTENSTSFQKDVNQLNKNIVFKGQANQEYSNQSRHHVVNTQYQNSSKQQNSNHNQKSKQEKLNFIKFTITHKIFETNCDFHVKQGTKEKGQFLFFRRFLLVLASFISG